MKKIQLTLRILFFIALAIAIASYAVENWPGTVQDAAWVATGSILGVLLILRWIARSKEQRKPQFT